MSPLPLLPSDVSPLRAPRGTPMSLIKVQDSGSHLTPRHSPELSTSVIRVIMSDDS